MKRVFFFFFFYCSTLTTLLTGIIYSMLTVHYLQCHGQRPSGPRPTLTIRYSQTRILYLLLTCIIQCCMSYNTKLRNTYRTGFAKSRPAARWAAGRELGRGPRAVGRGPPGRGPAFSKTPYRTLSTIHLQGWHWVVTGNIRKNKNRKEERKWNVNFKFR